MVTGAFFMCFIVIARACLWDSDTLAHEKRQHPTLATAILSPPNDAPDVGALRARLVSLRSNPKEDDPAWWNDLAGAHIRLGQSAEAVKILEPLTNRFPSDYGLHANLGTAYHLLGRYTEAEREIARDLEINPDAHFGLEKYHLALLQYLIRDEGYRLRHVYVNEFTQSFLYEAGMHARSDPFPAEKGNGSQAAALQKEGEELTASLPTNRVMSRSELSSVGGRLLEVAWFDPAPAYRSKWDLGNDANLEKGVIYMAGLNQKEPACWVMLGILAAKNRDKNLTIAAYEKALNLSSPQAPLLRSQIELLREHISKARGMKSDMHTALISGVVLLLLFLGTIIFVIRLVQRKLSRRAAKAANETED